MMTTGSASSPGPQMALSVTSSASDFLREVSLRSSLNQGDAHVPTSTDARDAPVKLHSIALESGQLGQKWDAAKGGHQTLPTERFATFLGDKITASWLPSTACATDWQAFQQDGEVRK